MCVHVLLIVFCCGQNTNAVRSVPNFVDFPAGVYSCVADSVLVWAEH